MGTKECIIGDFTREEFEKIYESPHKGEQLYAYTEEELKFLSEVSPLTVMEINDITDSNYPLNEENLRKQAISLASYLTQTIDSSIFHGIMREDMVESKVRNLEKAYLCLNGESPIKEEDVTEENMLSVAYDVKKHALEICRMFEKDFDKYTAFEREGEFEFIGFFEKLFDSNLKGIIQYGSSVSDLENAGDIDLLLLVDNFDESIYDLIKNQAVKVPYTKPIGIIIIPYDNLNSYVACDPSRRSIATKEGGRLIYGDPLQFPFPDEEEVINQEYIQAGKTFTSLRGALTNEKQLNAMINDSNFPKFVENTLKSEIWIRKALKQKEMGKILSKDDFLALEPVEIYHFGTRPSLAELKRELYNSNYRVKEAICRMFEKEE